jgi:hypothetical protein
MTRKQTTRVEIAGRRTLGSIGPILTVGHSLHARESFGKLLVMNEV